ncbi:MAG: threonine/serine dehydratase [Eubacteriales bacterium]|nr:threonine/serine dehydratase [Eubacteriales bacterium]
MIGIEEVKRAKEVINTCIIKNMMYDTPLIRSASISEIAGTDVYLKCENLQKTGSFKVRGAFNHISTLSEEQREKGVVCASTGNHSQAVGYAASMLGMKSWMVMPEYTTLIKQECSRRYGTEVVITGSVWKETYEKAQKISHEYGCDYIDPGEDESLIAGQGTLGLEILEVLPDMDAVYVPVGGGGMIAGIAVAVKEISPKTRVIGVEPEHMNAMYQSFHSGKIQTIKRIPSVADGLGGISPCVLPYEIVSRYVDDMITVSEEEIKEATRLILQRTKMLAEPSGATALAGLLSGKAYTGKKNVCIVSGGNAEPEVLAEILGSACCK